MEIFRLLAALLAIITGLIALYRIIAKKREIKNNLAAEEPKAVADFEKAVGQKVLDTVTVGMYMRDDHQLWMAFSADYIYFADNEIFLRENEERFQTASRARSTLSARRWRTTRLELRDTSSEELFRCRMVVSKREFSQLSHYIKVR